MKKLHKTSWTIILYILFIIEVLCVLFFGGTAINVALTLAFPQASIEASNRELLSLSYLPLLFLGMSGGFVWLAFKTIKIINDLSGAKKCFDQSSYLQYANWKVITVTLITVATFYSVVRVFLGSAQ